MQGAGDQIVWDDEAAASAPVIWDDERPNFGNVVAGVEQNVPRSGTLAQFADLSPEALALNPDAAAMAAQPIADTAGEIQTGLEGIRDDAPYDPDVPIESPTLGRHRAPELEAERRTVGVPEGFARRVGSGLVALGEFADMANPASVPGRVAGMVTGAPTPGEELQSQLELDPETETYSGARAQAAAELPADLLTNFLPIERAAVLVSKFKPPFLRNPAVKDAALAGDLGPTAQGAATGDEIVDQALGDALKAGPSVPDAVRATKAGDIDVTPELRVPAEAAHGPRAAVERPVLPEGEPVPVPARADIPASEPAAPAAAAPEASRAPDVPANEPQPLYHASLADFDEFDAATHGTQSDPGVFGAGHYATGDERLAPFYLGSKRDQGLLYTVENRARNPKVFDSPGDAIEWQGERGTDSPEAAARVRDKYLAAGHDGVVIRNPETGKTLEAVAFDPRGLKVAAKREIKPGARAPKPQEPLPVERPEDVGRFDATRGRLGGEEIGWQERGGRIIRGQGGERGFGDVTGRTPWVAKSDFWPKYRTTDPNPLSEAEATRAWSKVQAGEKLTKREQRFADFVDEHAAADVNDYVDERYLAEETARQDYERGVRQSIRDFEGNENAEAVRGNEGQIPVGRAERIRGENQGREDLQRAGETRRTADTELDRRAGEARRNDEAVPIEGQTSIANAKVAEERARRGLEEVKHDLSRSDPEGWARAEQAAKENPDHGRQLAIELAQKPRPATKEEVFALIQDRQRIKNSRRAAYDRAELATDAGDAEKLASARAEIERLDAEMELNDVAARVTGHESAEGLRARQRMAREDYSMAALVQRAKVKKGAKLTPEEIARLEGLAKDIERREAALAEREAAARDRRSRSSGAKDPAGAKKRFDDLAAELRKIADKDQLVPGCVI